MLEANPPILFDDAQLLVFRDLHPAPAVFAQGEESEGSAPLPWYAEAPDNRPLVDQTQLSGTFNRTRLIAMQADPDVGILELCVAILAWGGMHRNNRDHLFKRPVEAWLDVARAIRAGELSRIAAFDAFAALCHQGAIVGMKPAYFTKLIYFLMPRGGAPIGYIMDQWLGCSVNLLCGREVVKMDHMLGWHQEKRAKAPERRITSHVSAWNTGRDYERFCTAIETLAAAMGADWDPEATELTLMSNGGKKPGAWRAHVKRERLARFGG
jgi:hypothetical protein